MRLQEEYFKRHGINLLPIYHVRNANLIFRLTSGHIVLRIEFIEITRRPGYYTFTYLRPNHNGYLDGEYFLKTSGDIRYDEYVNYLLKWTRQKADAPVKNSETRLAIWEMFLYCFDRWLVEHKLEKAAKDQDGFLEYLGHYHSLVREVYNTEFLKFECNYADWLVELINFYHKMREHETTK
jgi:hypothetical protein